MVTDTSVAMCAGHRRPDGRWFRKQRTVNPLMASTRVGAADGGLLGAG
jgi:hypothetical protein